jgi:hypothetical protein
MAAMTGEKLRKVLLVNRSLAAIKSREFLGVVIDADHFMADLRKTR